jgi:carbon-monoxide dehydrogenase medium subunit
MQFECLEPATLEEAVSLLVAHDGKASKVVAGGTDIVPGLAGGKIKDLDYLIDIGGIANLDYIQFDEKQCLRIGALTTIRSLENSPEIQQKIPVISKAASQLASVGVRNQATIGGNLCNAAPSADTAPALIGLSAKAKVFGPSGERFVPLEDFFIGPGKTVLGKGELLVEIQVPMPEPGTKGSYYKHMHRGSIDLAIVGVAAVGLFDSQTKTCKEIKIVLGAVAPTPIRAREAEKTLANKKIDDALIDKCAETAANEARPISDVRASAEYREEMIKVFTKRALKEIA